MYSEKFCEMMELERLFDGTPEAARIPADAVKRYRRLITERLEEADHAITAAQSERDRYHDSLVALTPGVVRIPVPTPVDMLGLCNGKTGPNTIRASLAWARTHAEVVVEAVVLSESGVGRIMAERRRQMEVEGWTPKHDAQHASGELAQAARCYAMEPGDDPDEQDLPEEWPWDPTWWKPTPHDRVRELAKAGALIAAEIDRLRAMQQDRGVVG